MRAFHKFYAWVCGYFWLPCPICGRYFGGHERTGTLMLTAHSGKCVCKNCIEIANFRNRELFSALAVDECGIWVEADKLRRV